MSSRTPASPLVPNSTGHALPIWLLAVAGLLVLSLVIAQLLGAFRSPATPTSVQPQPVQASTLDLSDNTDRRLLSDALQAAIADNRILSPLDDNAIATLIQLQASEVDAAWLQTTLLEIYPLAVQVVEGSLDREDLDLAAAQIALLERTGHASASLDLLHEKLGRALRKQDLDSLRAAASAAPESATSAVISTASAPAIFDTAVANAPSNDNSIATPAIAAIARSSNSLPSPPEGRSSAASDRRPAESVPASSVTTATAVQSSVESPPVQTAFAAPTYPARARSRRIEGEVELAFTIDRSGNPIDIRVIRAEPPNTFDIEAIRAAQRWRFEPGRVDGQAVDTPTTRTLRFELGG